MCAPVIQNKVIRRKRTLRTWSNYNHQKNSAACQASTGGSAALSGSVTWKRRCVLPCSPGLSAFPSSDCLAYCLIACFICLTPKFSSTLFTVLLPEFLSKFWDFFLSSVIEQSHFIVKEYQWTLILLILSYPGMVLNDIIKIDASPLLFKILSVCSFQPHLLLQCQNSSVAV